MKLHHNLPGSQISPIGFAIASSHSTLALRIVIQDLPGLISRAIIDDDEFKLHLDKMCFEPQQCKTSLINSCPETV